MKWEKWNLLTASEKEEYNYRFKGKIVFDFTGWFWMIALAVCTFGILNLNGFSVSASDMQLLGYLLTLCIVFDILAVAYYTKKSDQWMESKITETRKSR